MYKRFQVKMFDVDERYLMRLLHLWIDEGRVGIKNKKGAQIL